MTFRELWSWVFTAELVLLLPAITWWLFRLSRRVRVLETASTRVRRFLLDPDGKYSSNPAFAAAPASDLQSTITHRPATDVSVIAGGDNPVADTIAELFAATAGRLFAGEDPLNRNQASLKLSHTAEQPDDGQSRLCGAGDECAAGCLGLFDTVGNLLDHGFGDRQVVRDGVAESDEVHDSKTPYVARAVTRYVTGAFCVARRWLQRKAGCRQSADPSPLPSDTTGEAGAVPPVPAPASPRSSQCASRWASRLDGYTTYRCTRTSGHDGRHGYAGIRWTDSEAVQ